MSVYNFISVLHLQAYGGNHEKILKYSLASLILICIVASSLCSCGDASKEFEQYEQYFDVIYRGGIEIYVYDGITYSTDESAPSKLTFKIKGADEDFYYHETVLLPHTNTRYHVYYWDGDEDRDIRINEDGSIHSIHFDFAKIDISNTASPDEVLPILEAELDKWFDISFYDEVDIPETYDDDSDGFGGYEFQYTKTQNGYVTGSATARVNDDGEVTSFSTINVNYDRDKESLETDHELESELVAAKLDDIFNTDESKLVSYQTAFSPRLIFIDGELYINNYVYVDYSEKDGLFTWEESQCIEEILIPLELIAVDN